MVNKRSKQLAADQEIAAMAKGPMLDAPAVPTLANLEVVVMENGEVLCLGKSIGYVSKLGRFLTRKI